MKKPITVMLADDHTVVREGLRMVLETKKDIRVIAEARNGREAVELAKKLRPDVVVMDIAMPLLNGFEAAVQIMKAVTATKILVLSAHSDDEYIDRMIAIGASGFLIKQSSAEVLSKAIQEVKNGNTFFSADITKRLEKKNKQSLGRNGIFKKKNVRLSSREAEALQLIAEGKANKEIAAELGISIKTVEKHRQHLMEKLNIHDTAGLTRYAISAGIIESSVQITIR
ncbi:MAG: DNA-binding response regulator [Omnitrophica bacterium GWA2_52_8]|nr:MAG: DNA-binding response regulator [Omnitrophica bacterium GWA2_52_8]